jgi:hypothetical protein
MKMATGHTGVQTEESIVLNQNGHSRETGNIRYTRQTKTKQKHKIYVLDIINFRGGSRISS